MSDEPLMAGGVVVKMPTANNSQLFMLIWGDSGAGKTTLAATAPGKKLLVLFDPGGDLSLADREDVLVLDLSAMPTLQVMAQFRSADPYGIGKLLDARPDIETVIVDSMTALAYIALKEAVQRAGGARTSLEQPGMNGYAFRNASLLRMTVALMQICAGHKRHLILVTHEGAEDRNEEGIVLSVTMALSSSVANQVGLRFNEVLHLRDDGKDRWIAIRPCRLRKPMKTRMFLPTASEFRWTYNPDTREGDGIAKWYAQWQASKGKKIPIPGAKK